MKAIILQEDLKRTSWIEIHTAHPNHQQSLWLEHIESFFKSKNNIKGISTARAEM